MLSKASVIIVVSLLCLLKSVRSQDGRIFECTNDDVNGSRRTLHVHCAGNEVIRINEAIYGLNRFQHCMYTVGDCVENIDLDDECCGYNECNVTIWRVFSARCGNYVSFFRLIYDCIPAYQSDCIVPGMIVDTTEKAATTTYAGGAMIPTETAYIEPSRPRKEVTVPEEEDSDDLTNILGSAALVALLLAAIVTVVFLLKRFQWQSEKQCFLQMFVGMCTRHPPDGCEDPDEAIQRSNQDHSVPVTQNVTEMEANNNQNHEDTTQVVLTIESDSSSIGEENNDHLPEVTQDHTPQGKRKRKRNEPSPDMEVIKESQNLTDDMSLYSRNILYNRTIDKQNVNKKLSFRHVPVAITEVKENVSQVTSASAEDSGTTAV